MKPNKNVSSGVRYLDNIIGGFQIGDNVVWQVEPGTFDDLFYLSFIKVSLRDKKKVIFVSFNSSPKTVLQKLGGCSNNRNVTLLDCFTSGKGEKSGIFLNFYKSDYKKYKCKIIHVKEPADVPKFIELLNRIEESYPKGTRYIFDSITGIQDLWGESEQAMKLFTHQCPRLYELQTIAHWILEKDAHSEKFRAQLNHITQVVINLSADNGICNLTVVKAENRLTSNISKPQQYEIVNSKIQFVAQKKETLNIGSNLRHIREERDISQAELAKKIGVTPSTISQVESNLISLSLPALVKLAKTLNIPIGYLLSEIDNSPSQFIFRKDDRVPATAVDISKKEIIRESLVPDSLIKDIKMYIVNILPGISVDRHFFLHRGEEIGFLISGILELTLKEKKYIIKEGDIVHLRLDIPSGWKNPTDKMASILWILKS
ncbi:MAG TPA: XRE family transcriptional regulator [Elusimicrobia bacterium]|nr:XRE family transcriptional regulator [Elusimicrobiota bacterium]